MPRKKTKLFDDNTHILHPGEYYATTGNNILGTVTGSSVVVCLYDKEKKIGGMGHFIVPGTIGTKGLISDEIARVGITNMEYLMGEIVKLGGDRKRLQVKVFGAGEGSGADDRISDIVRGNIQFIHQYFKMEEIEIEEEALGGAKKRKIHFNPTNGNVKEELVTDDAASEFLEVEKEYIDRVFKDMDETGKVILFE